MAQGKQKKSLGSWFPSASVCKVEKYPESAKITITLFYHYVSPLWNESRKNEAQRFIENCGMECNIGGRVRVSREGLNATISGPKENVERFLGSLKSFEPQFEATEFKHIHDMPQDRAFKDLKVLPVKELVYYGIDAEADLGPGGTHTCYNHFPM
jgi:predicted sulfurtransferase